MVRIQARNGHVFQFSLTKAPSCRIVNSSFESLAWSFSRLKLEGRLNGTSVIKSGFPGCLQDPIQSIKAPISISQKSQGTGSTAIPKEKEQIGILVYIRGARILRIVLNHQEAVLEICLYSQTERMLRPSAHAQT